MTSKALLALADVLEETERALSASLRAASAAIREAAATNPARLLTYNDAAEFLQVHPATISKLVTSGALPAVGIGEGKHARRIRLVDLEAYVKRQTTRPRRIHSILQDRTA